MGNASLIENSHLHHYRILMKKLDTQEEKSAPKENNREIEDQ
jgi:hypothetical protein